MYLYGQFMLGHYVRSQLKVCGQMLINVRSTNMHAHIHIHECLQR